MDKAPQVNTTSFNLTDMGWAAVRTYWTVSRSDRELYGWESLADPEVTVNACGVAVTMPQGHSWAPHLSNGEQ